MTRPSRATLALPGGDEVVVYRHRAAKAAARSPLVIVHGYAEHAGRHALLARSASRAGHEVFALDLQGHGRSPGPRALVRSYEQLVAAVSALVDHATYETGARPALFGHSMGGAVALAYALTNASSISRLVLSAPYLLDSNPRPSWQVALAGPVAAVAPTLPVAKLSSEDLARDPEVGAAYVADPLVYSGAVAAATGHTLTSMGRRLLDSAGELKVPTLIVHGSGDRVASVDGSRSLAEAADDARLVVIEDAFHEMHNEPEETGVPQRFLEEVLGFIEEPTSEDLR